MSAILGLYSGYSDGFMSVNLTTPISRLDDPNTLSPKGMMISEIKNLSIVPKNEFFRSTPLGKLRCSSSSLALLVKDIAATPL